MNTNYFVKLTVVAVLVLTAGCQTRRSIDVTSQSLLTVDGLGAAQGAAQHDGFVYLYGDAETGVIREYAFANGDSPRLRFTGRQIALTRDGEDLINHPTGLTWHPQYGTFLGNSVTATKQATIFHLNWPQALADGNLDHAVLNIIDDDLAVQGCRPEFVRRGDLWLLATADYGEVDNAVRYYDPARLAMAERTSEPGVLVARFRCAPWVQQLHWLDEHETLILVQNREPGLLWRLTAVAPWHVSDYRVAMTFDGLDRPDELEGFTRLSRTQCLLITSSQADNVMIGAFEVR